MNETGYTLNKLQTCPNKQDHLRHGAVPALTLIGSMKALKAVSLNTLVSNMVFSMKGIEPQ